MRAVFAALLAATFLVATPASPQSPLRITFLDVGQADAIILEAPEGQTALVDAGAGDITHLLEERNIERFDLVVATHPHADHIGGMADLLQGVPVRFYIDNGQTHTTDTYARLLETLRHHTEITYLSAEPRTIAFGGAEIDVLPIPKGATDNLNNRSVGLVVRYGSFRAFLSGDSEREELSHFLERRVVPDVTVLKAPHHGSDGGVTSPFLAAARPEVVVVSVGANSYGHPGAEALRAYGSMAEHLYRTDMHGHVTVLGWQDGRYEVHSGGGRVAAGRERGDGTSGASDLGGRMPTAALGASRTQDARPGPSGTVGSELRASGADPSAELTLRVVADAPGNDHNNTNGEYVVLQSGAARAVDIGGWTLCDLVRHCFRFPDGASLPAGGHVVVYTGRGVADGVRFYMNRGRAVWNNDGDTATLSDRSGNLVVRHSYE